MVEHEEGTAQGASVSPLLSNVYLHYVFDLWADQLGGVTREEMSFSRGSPTTTCLSLST